MSNSIDTSNDTVGAVSVSPSLIDSSHKNNNALTLALTQEDLHYLDQGLQPNKPARNITVAVQLTGKLDLSLLEQSFNEILQRHASLRITFSTINGQPTPVITPTSPVTLKPIDLQNTPAAHRQTEILKLITTDARQPINITQGLPWRAKLLQLTETEYIFLFIAHHIIFEMISKDIFIQELKTGYESASQSQSVPISELPIQDVDIVPWQRQWMSGDLLDKQLAYWMEKLKGDLSPLQLPTDHPRTPEQMLHRTTESLTLPQSLTQAINDLSKPENVPLSTVLLTVFKILLHRYTNQNDISVGLPVSRRNRVEVSPLINFLENNLVLRTHVSEELSFQALLKQVHSVVVEAYTHQEIPFEELITALQPEKVLHYHPLFQVMFNYQEAPSTTFQLSDLTMHILDLEPNFPPVDVALTVQKKKEALSATLAYNPDLFDASTIRRMLGHYQTVLAEVIAYPDKPISALALLTQTERQQLLTQWNDTQVPYPGVLCVHRLFETQVEQTPNAVAVVFEGKQLTYAELNSQANQLAHHLQQSGLRPGALVSICMERSIEQVVAILATLKAGGAYIPVDPAYPAQRIVHILTDSQANILLTQQKLIVQLPKNQANVICLDQAWPDIATQAISNPVAQVMPDHLAYVIYTSGSTGKPKGVAMSHRPLHNLIRWQRQRSRLPLEAKTLQFASFSFDVSFQELFTTWCAGGTLYLITEETRRDTSKLLKFITDASIERLFLPFIALQHLAEVAEIQGPIPTSLKEVITAGEQLQITPYIESLFKKLADCVLDNQYGPSESHVVTAFMLKGGPDSWPALPPIGRPIANAQVYILDQHLNSVPIGVPGELYLGGVALARGYLHRPDLTAEKFVADPFSPQPDARLYRTGDTARYLPDGNIEFLGRIDHQVKIRGFRVELGEIEATLSRHPAIQAVAVIVREDTPGDKRLVAYLVLDPKTAPSTSELRSFLSEKLPDYMIPSAFVTLDRLPLTPSGKINRRALPFPEQIRSELEESFVVPGTPIEKTLAGIWGQVLNIEQIGIHDNFFELGGYSLLATRILSQIFTHFEIDLSLRALFERPTIAKLALKIEDLLAAKIDDFTVEQGQDHETALKRPLGDQLHKQSKLSAIPKRPVQSQTPLSWLQQGLWFLHKLNPNSPFHNIPIAIRLKGTLNVTALEQSLNDIVQRHEALRTTFIEVHEQPAQLIKPPHTLDLPVIDLSHLSIEEQEDNVHQWAVNEAKHCFDLKQGPLLQTKLLRLNAQEHVLLLVMHHLISDGWSLEILAHELNLLYEGYVTREPAVLPELSIQYADYAHWQQETVLKEHLNYWKQQLSGSLPLLQLPTDHPRPAVQAFRGAKTYHPLPDKLFTELKTLSHKQGATLFMTMLAAFKILLYRYTGQEDILVGTPVANRSRRELEGLIGFFVNTLVLRTDLSNNPNFVALLNRVKEVTLEAHTHQALPFEKLVEALNPERNLSYNPLFQVMFTDEGKSALTQELSGLVVEELDIDQGTSQFDLTMFMEETEAGLRVKVEYNTDLFSPQTINRFLGHYERLLEGIVTNPTQQIADIPFLLEAEQHQLLVTWNDTAVPYPQDKGLHHLFEEQVERTPNAIALVFEETQLTYRELNERANQLAHHLQKLGIGPETLVGVFTERSLEMVIALYGVLKAGGTYLPLDPAFPSERLAFMAQDAQVSLILTQQELLDEIFQHDAALICLDTDWEAIASSNQQQPITSRPTPEDLAYIIYTSGSTGKPKGVQLPHRAAVNFLTTMAQEPGLQPDDILLAVTTLSFDIALLELFLPLSVGACVVIADRNTVADGYQLMQLLTQHHITVMQATPATWRLLLDAGWQGSDQLKILCGGEAFPQDLASQLLGKCQSLWNMYGPTETTVWSTIHQVTEVNGSIPIGRPIANTEIYILDDRLQPVPVGVPGLLYIGGQGLAKGYLNRPELTADKFIPHPFSTQPGARLYCTGDLARYLPDGRLECLGRIDHQVKVRGYRIELGEIEAVLNQLPDVEQALVIVREDTPGDKRLVAYLIATQTELPIAELRQTLKQTLPDYMVPTSFVPLDTFPLTPNGKIDRNALPSPELSRDDLEAAYVAPETLVEEALADIWRDILGIEQVGIRDNFFDLGGHSLLATRVVSQIQHTFEITIPLNDFFKAPTISELALLLEELLLDEMDALDALPEE